MKKETDGRIHRFSLGAMALLVALAFTISLAARPGTNARAQDKGTPAKTAQEKRDSEVYNALSKCWQTFYTWRIQL